MQKSEDGNEKLPGEEGCFWENKTGVILLTITIEMGQHDKMETIKIQFIKIHGLNLSFSGFLIRVSSWMVYSFP